MATVIPSWMLKSSISVEAYEGETATGPKWAAGVTLSAHVEPRRRLIVMRDGREVRTEMFALVAPDATIPPESRVTYGARTYRVLDVFEVPSPTGGVHHLELAMA